MSEENKAIVRRLMLEVWCQGRLEVIDEICAPSFVGHGLPPVVSPDREGLKQVVAMYRAAYPDVQMTIEDQIAEGDMVVTRWSGRGTHKGELMGIPATGKQITVTGIDINRIAGGKLIDGWGQFDALGMMQQLGVVPSPGQSA